jgi:2-(1,2-epoxy-1,2-dihydrophenyl)acetyl-CoA isomerase
LTTQASTLRYSVTDGVARLTLARPDVSNSVDLPTAMAFHDAVTQAATDPHVRAVLVDAYGPRFCAGGDVRAMANAADRRAFVAELADALDAALTELAALPKPVVAAVQGVVAGAGMAVVLAADVVVASVDATFRTAYGAVGLTPDCGLSYLLPRAIGQARALDLVLTGRALTAQEALDWGLLTRVVEADALHAQADELASQLAAAPPFAVGEAKRLVRSTWSVSRAECTADEVRTIAAAIETPEAVALVSRFTAPPRNG